MTFEVNDPRAVRRRAKKVGIWGYVLADTLDDGRSDAYQMSAATDAAATSINAGNCG